MNGINSVLHFIDWTSSNGIHCKYLEPFFHFAQECCYCRICPGRPPFLGKANEGNEGGISQERVFYSVPISGQSLIIVDEGWLSKRGCII